MKPINARSRTRQEPRPVDPARHQRSCTVCRHPDRALIEREFLHWRSPDEIAYEHRISGRASIYRHAKATGLLARRRHSAYAVLELLIERAADAPLTGSHIVSAVRLYAQINDDGQRVAPPNSVHRTHSASPSTSDSASSTPPVPAEPSEPSDRAQPSQPPAFLPLRKGKPAETSEPQRAAPPPKPPEAGQARDAQAARTRRQPGTRRARTAPHAKREGTAPKKPAPDPTPNATPTPTPNTPLDPTPAVSTPAITYAPPTMNHRFLPARHWKP